METPAYEGSCYNAAHWIRVGQTQGRGRNGSHHAGKSIKDVHLYPLVDDFQDRVGVKLDLESILQTHRAQTLRRMKQQSTALLVQDTTDLNFSTRRGWEGLGQIGTNQTGAKSRGLRLHSSLALSEHGLPLGIVQLPGWTANV